MTMAEERTLAEKFASLKSAFDERTDTIFKALERIEGLLARPAQCPNECNAQIVELKAKVHNLEETHNKITDGAAAMIAAERERSDLRMDKIRNDLDDNHRRDMDEVVGKGGELDKMKAAHKSDVDGLYTWIRWLAGVLVALALMGAGVIVQHIFG